jgi:His-Xaa-Ser system radical SAM maturase HxsC
MKSAQGQAANIDSAVLGRITKKPRFFWNRDGFVLVTPEGVLPGSGYSGILCEGTLGSTAGTQVQHVSAEFLAGLQEGDIVLISPDGNINVLWEHSSFQNALLLTESCDCRCLMCPQPPQHHDDNMVHLSMQILDMLRPREVSAICLTGGEPTLNKDAFISVLQKIAEKFPKTSVSILTNAKNLADFEYAKQCVLAAPADSLFCVSLHADNDRDHDAIVGMPGSFQKTVKGIINLAKLRAQIELRFVVNLVNASRMTSFGDFVFRNFPFVAHVAFMAMEIRGLAVQNMDAIWIDPADYGETITKAADQLHRTGMATSIYNMPLCLLPQEGWPLARRSISAWKNDFLPICDVCLMKSECAGIFTSSVHQSDSIRPILT